MNSASRPKRSFRSVFSLLVLVFLIGCRSPEKSLQAGKALQDQGKYDEAVIQYRRAIQANPGYGEAYHGLGLALWRQGDLVGAYQSLQKAIGLLADNDQVMADFADLALSSVLAQAVPSPDLVKALTDLSNKALTKNAQSFLGLRVKGLLAMAANNPPEAVRLLEQANKVRPDHAETANALVQNLLLIDRGKDAESLAVRSIKAQPRFGPLYDTLYFHYMGSGRPAEAEQVIRRKIDANPQDGLRQTQLARHFWRTKRTSEFDQLMGAFVRNTREFPDARLLAGDLYGELGRWDDALAQYQAGLQSDPERRTIYRKQIVSVYLAQGKRAEAARALEDTLKEAPEDKDARAAKAELLLYSAKKEDVDEGLRLLEQLTKSQPGDTRYRASYGRALARNGRSEQARQQLALLLRSDPSNGDALQQLAGYYLERGQFTEALRYANRLLTLFPDDYDAMLLRTGSLANLGRLDEARSDLQRLINRFPDRPVPQLQLAMVYVRQQRYRDAEDLLRRNYRPETNDFRALPVMVESYIAQGLGDRAIERLQEELRKSPNSDEVRGTLASAALRLGKFDVAIEQYHKMLARQPDSPSLLLNLGMTYHKMGDKANALQYIEKARVSMPTNPAPLVALAEAHADSGNRKEAIAGFRAYLNLQPENPLVMNNLAFLLADGGENLDEALRLATGATQKAPQEPDYADTLGLVYLKQRNHDAAARVFQTISRRRPDNPTYRHHLGLALLAKGDRAGARAEFEAALQRKPSPDEAGRLRQTLAGCCR